MFADITYMMGDEDTMGKPNLVELAAASDHPEVHACLERGGVQATDGY